MSADGKRFVLRNLLDGFDPAGLGEFVPLWPGVDILPLYGLLPSGEPIARDQPSAALLRYAPGAAVPLHRHPAYEQIFVLSGSQRDHGGTYGPGTCVLSPPGTEHSVSSEEGCLVLAIWNQSVELRNG